MHGCVYWGGGGVMVIHINQLEVFLKMIDVCAGMLVMLFTYLASFVKKSVIITHWAGGCDTVAF